MYRKKSTSSQVSSKRFQEIYSLSKKFSASQNFNLEQVFNEAAKYQDPQYSLSQILEVLEQSDFQSTFETSSNPANSDYDVYLAFGETGEGKSAFTNAICGSQVAKEGKGIKSKTEKIGLYVSDKHKIIMIDTPGLFDTRGIKNREILDQIIQVVQDRLEQNAHIKAIFFIWSPTSSMRLRLKQILTSLENALGEDAIDSVIFLINKVSHLWGEEHKEAFEQFLDLLEEKRLTNPVFKCDLKKMTQNDVNKLKSLTEKVKPFREEDFETHRTNVYSKKFSEIQKINEEKKERENMKRELREKEEKINQMKREAEYQAAQEKERQRREEEDKQKAQYQATLNASLNAASDYYSYHPASYHIYDFTVPNYYSPQLKTSYQTAPSKSQISDSPAAGQKFYKGGQFIPGGGHAPTGGCWAQLTPAKSQNTSSQPQSTNCSHEGMKLYKGGQFIPGGGHAPKGGKWV